MSQNFNFPHVEAPFANLETGKINPEWLMLLVNLFKVTGGGSTSINVDQIQAVIALQRQPNISALINSLNEVQNTLSMMRNERSTIESLRSRINDIESQISALRNPTVDKTPFDELQLITLGTRTWL